MLDLRVLLLLLAITGCATVPPAPPAAPPDGGATWDLAPSVAPERFSLRLPGVGRITFSRLEPVAPIGLERGESFVGVGVDVLGIGFAADEEPVRPPPPPRPIDPDLRRVEERRRRDELDRSIDRVLDAAERAREGPPEPSP